MSGPPSAGPSLSVGREPLRSARPWAPRAFLSLLLYYPGKEEAPVGRPSGAVHRDPDGLAQVVYSAFSFTYS
jgi:hypothetical protein